MAKYAVVRRARAKDNPGEKTRRKSALKIRRGAERRAYLSNERAASLAPLHPYIGLVWVERARISIFA